MLIFFTINSIIDARPAYGSMVFFKAGSNAVSSNRYPPTFARNVGDVTPIPHIRGMQGNAGNVGMLSVYVAG